MKCAACGRQRPETEFAWIGDTPYCHPALGEGVTCYMQMVTDHYASASDWLRL